MSVVPSARAIALIEQFEISGWGSYSPRVSWPGGASGLTIGCGYDCGYASPEQIGDDWHALPAGTVMRLQSYAGRTGQSAANALHGTSDIIVPAPIARAVFEGRDIPRYSAMTAAAFPGCEHLPGDCFGALVSLVFNRGASMTDTNPNNRLEMRQIRDAIAASNFAAVSGFIKQMKRLWVDKGLNGLLTRRDAEADLFEAGLSQVAAQFGQVIPSLSTDDLNDKEFARVAP